MSRQGAFALLCVAVFAGCPTNSVIPPDDEDSSSSGSTSPTEPAPPLGCGDGTVAGSEECDDGNADNTDDCTDSCTLAVCGDGYVQAGVETCDDGQGNSAEAWTPAESCKSDCNGFTDYCGDGTCQAEFEDAARCTADCTAACGNGVLEPGEVCDDGTTDNTGSCVANCKMDAACGDGFLWDGMEDCDDGDDDNDDECVEGCKVAACGDGFVQAGVEDCEDGNDVNDDDCSNACESPRRVFVTSTIFKGNLGGLDGADLKCQMLADGASLGGTFRAWLSDDTGSPSSRFDTSFTGAYKLVDGTLIASGWTDLTDGTLAKAINTNEKNDLTEGENIWTNTGPDGLPVPDGKHCNDWTSTTNDVTNKAAIGFNDSSDSTWTAYDTSTCNSSNRLYCFEDL